MGSVAVQELRTNADDVAPTSVEAGVAVLSLGGTRIYGPDEITLREGLKTVSKIILSCSQRQSCIDANYLLGLCRQELDVPIAKNIFHAALGREARLGNVERPVLRTAHGKSYRVVVSGKRIDEYRKQVSEVIEMARNTRDISVRDVQDTFYPKREKGTWFVAQQILQRVAYLGFLNQIDKWNFQVPELLLNAKSEVDGRFLTPNPERLA